MTIDPPPATTLDVSAGSILAYRLFDVAYAIDLEKAEETWARTVRTGSSRGRLTTTPPKAIASSQVASRNTCITLSGSIANLPDLGASDLRISGTVRRCG